ncbi:peptidoglycan-binding protein [Herbidospora galbida]|uniref:C40 family peptidase n=1 Tax=Herbidospora galbida TaxID=2575442 RepID=UPI001484FD18|nr:peptidoglycan-binding protein [Herbidospora galbida]
MSDLIITAEEYIAVLLSQEGKGEKNGASTYGIWYGDRVKDSGFDKAAWCDVFTGWAAWEAGRKKGGLDAAEAALAQVGCFAWTPSHARWFASNGRLGNTATRGSIAFVDYQRTDTVAGVDHVGVVLGRDKQGRVVTIDGNISNKVTVCARYDNVFVGFGYPRWATKATPAPTTPSKPTKPGSTRPKFPLAPDHWFGIKSDDPRNHSGTNPDDQLKIKQLQQLLNTAGAKLTVDGIYGAKTKQAVIDFQTKAGIVADGEAGIITWAALTL